MQAINFISDKFTKFREKLGNMDRKKWLKLFFDVIIFLFMALVTVAILYPLLFVLTTSFKDYNEFLKFPFNIMFSHPENYAVAWVKGRFSVYFFNSVLVAACAVGGQIILTALAAFTIGRLEFKGSNVLLFVMLSTMFLTGEITSVPMFLLIRELGFYDTILALIFPAALGAPGMGALLASNYIKGIPKEIHEAAVLDGASIPQTFWHLDFPLMKPMLTLVAVMCFNGIWSDFMWPLIALPTNRSAWTMPLGLITFQSENNAQYGILCAGLVILTLPIVVFYSFFSKYFIEGVAAGAVKG